MILHIEIHKQIVWAEKTKDKAHTWQNLLHMHTFRVPVSRKTSCKTKFFNVQSQGAMAPCSLSSWIYTSRASVAYSFNEIKNGVFFCHIVYIAGFRANILTRGGARASCEITIFAEQWTNFLANVWRSMGATLSLSYSSGCFHKTKSR